MIDYEMLNESISFYKECGYLQIEVPWMVPKPFDDITRPKDKLPLSLENGNSLIGSGEQGFIYLISKGHLIPGKYQTITPCFRSDPEDLSHFPQFIKNELIKFDVVNDEEMTKMVETSYEFIKKYHDGVTIKKKETGYDIMLGEIELGSYGIRETNFFSWIYGTGCALPRMSVVKYGIS